jgi:CRP-like cAMP-binding protein
MYANVPAANRLLASLPASQQRAFLRRLDKVPLRLHETLCQPDQRHAHVYFPTGGMISMVQVTGAGDTVEAGVVGKEGMVGLSLLLGSDTSLFTALVQVPGTALRLEADAFRAEVERNAALRRVLLRYAEAFLAMLLQTATCDHFHTVDKRVCYWLLMTHDRVEADEFPITHKLLGRMLGVRRATVTEAAQKLQRAGLVRYGNGRVKIHDRAGLEAAACECYARLRSRHERLLPPDQPRAKRGRT